MSVLFRTVLLAVTFSATIALAADHVPDSGLLLRESTPPVSPKKQMVMPLVEAPVGVNNKPLSSMRVKVTGFQFVGNTVMSSTQLQELLAGDVGKEMSLADLDVVAMTITNAYRAKGYFLASAFIPPQTLKHDAVITIKIIECVLEEVTLLTKPETTRIPRNTLLDYISQVPKGSPAMDGSLTEMVMKVNELPGISSRILLEAGEQQGGTKAVLEVTEGKPYGFSLDTDNQGSSSTGYYRVGAALELYSPLHLGDQFSLRGQSSTTGDTQTVRSSFSMPLNKFGTKIGLDYGYVTYHLAGVFEALKGHGDAHDISMNLSHPLIRNRNLILSAAISGGGKLLDDRIDSTGSRNYRHTFSWQANLSGVEMDSLLAGGSTSFSVGVTFGNLMVDDSTARAQDQSGSGFNTEGGYSKISMNISRTQGLLEALSLYGSANGQWADKNLDSSEQFSLGGPNGVRAWRPGDVSGDKGAVCSAELRYLIDTSPLMSGGLQPSLFIDYGSVVLHNSPLTGVNDNTRNLAGAGFGVSWFDTSGFSAKSSVAWKVAGDTTPTNSPMVYLQVMKRF